jgi:regulator of cell morphogenesis and NO signaling
MNLSSPEAGRPQRTVGEIAATVPGATAVFREHRIDFCCHGDLTLEAAARRRGVDPEEIARALSELNTGAGAPAPPVTMSSEALIEHIESYHEAHRRALPELMALARKVEAVHSEHPNVPNGLFATLQQMEAELEAHMRMEETSLFPAMRRAAYGLDATIGALRHEHDDQAGILNRLESLTDDFTLPDGACRSWQALYVGTAQLVGEVMEHIHLENNVLFPRFASAESRA